MAAYMIFMREAPVRDADAMSMCATPLDYVIGALTADEDRVVAEVRSTGTLINGEAYANTYVFVLRIRDGRIAAVAEHYNALIAQEKLVPLMKTLATAGSPATTRTDMAEDRIGLNA